MTGEYHDPSVPTGQENQDNAKTPFPSARYFQIHFEHLESLLATTRQEVASLREHLEEIGKLLLDSPKTVNDSPRSPRRAQKPSVAHQEQEEPMENPQNGPSLQLRMTPASK
jgi:hypothetical protein